MSDDIWHNLIDAIGTVALVALAIGYLAWDRWMDVIEGTSTGKGRFDDDWI